MSSVCRECGHVHVSTDAIAVGRFREDGVLGYTSTVHPERLLRATREEALKDTCEWRKQNSAMIVEGASHE